MSIVEEVQEKIRRERSSAPPPPAGPAVEVVFRTMNDVHPRAVHWLMLHWIPRGSLTVLDGDPGQGKSTLTLDLAARLAGAALPAAAGILGDPERAQVLLLSAEDDPEQTIRPRLDAAGADVSQIHFLEKVRVGKEERPPVLPYDLDLVADRVKGLGVALIVVDPFAAFLGSEFDAHKDQDIRRCLHRLVLLARLTDTALLLVRHLNKLSGGPALYRGGGSIGIVGAARAALVVGRDPADDTRHVLAMNKSNLGPIPRSMVYTVEAAQGVARIVWQGETDLMAEDILWHKPAKGRPPEELQEAMDFLTDLLRDAPKPVAEVHEAASDAGISKRTLERAKADLGVRSRKVSLTGGWVWSVH